MSNSAKQNEIQSPCTDCPLRASCQHPCEKVEALLERPFAPRTFLSEGEFQAFLKRIVIRRGFTRELIEHRDVLSARQRKVFDLFFNEGLTQESIAECLGIRRTNVAQLLARAMRRIVKEVKRA